jgi:phage tail sheath gpL-like
VNGSPSPPWDWVADWMGAVAVSVRAQASRPVWTLGMQTVLAPAQGNWWNYASTQALLAAGIAAPAFSPYAPPTIARSVTTYKTNAYGVSDQSYQDDTTMFTLMEITRRLKAGVTQKFARCILVPNGTTAGPASNAVTPNDALAEIITLYNGMENDGLVTSAAVMIAGTVVQINAQNPKRLDILWDPQLANGLAMVAVNNQFSLNPAQAN